MTKINSAKSTANKLKIPKYQKIGETLVNQILSGEYAIDTLLPTEKQLCFQFSISRHTAREALRYAEKCGLVERKQGSGTLVKRNEMPEQINHFVNSVNDLLQFGQHTKFEVKTSDLVAVDIELANLLNIGTSELCLYIGGVRVEAHDKKPICFSHIYRRPHADQYDEAFKDTKTAIYAIMEVLRSSNIGKIEQHTDACLLPESLAYQLDAPANSAAMKITRRYYCSNLDEILLVSQSIYPAKRFSLSSVLYPNSK
ncbi:GntR family transcriptional regulator [Glaciecola punicea]|jgi:DNA-binding GntR family transcriptional regulator|uniref:GntR family transcriptional regulator n=1 Tax=Glaciecola punicea TaxID=56804 RepID=UPI0008721DF9|nr:GntR family transcriptional regulator [Glaciecola punicea]OFA29854.1 GntR family transcriptional regulator [Glaciecola punicea]